MKLNSKTITYEQLAKTIDHSLLKPELAEDRMVIASCVSVVGQFLSIGQLHFGAFTVFRTHQEKQF